MRKQKRLIGDSKIVGDGRAYHLSLSLEEAREMVDLLCSACRLPKVEVIFARQNTKGKYGRYVITHTKKRKMYLNKPTEGTILHELAHEKTFYHNKRFKKFQEKLYKTWYGENEK